MHVDAISRANHPASERTVQQFVEPAAATATKHELRGLLGMRERHQSLGGRRGDDIVNATTELFDEAPLRRERLGIVHAQAVIGGDVHAYEIAADSPRHSRRPADQHVAAASARDPDDDRARVSPTRR